MDRSLHFVAGSTLTDPHHTVAGLLASVENSNHIAGAELGVKARQQRPTQADLAGVGFLQEAVAPRVYAPNRESKVNIGTRLAPAVLALTVVASSINAAEISHASP